MRRALDDLVLSWPLDDQARAQFGHAFVAGPAFYRAVAASAEWRPASSRFLPIASSSLAPK
jgi:hypothetical protein